MTMPNSCSEILDKVLAALKCFFNKDRSLLSLNASERSITHKLGEYLQKEFAEWDVDCEYNRRYYRSKTLPGILFNDIREDDHEAKTIFPDIVVHRRNQPDNLLVIEVKKFHNNVGSNTDEIKLKAFTSREEDYNYKVGLFVELDVDRHKISNVKYFEGGREVPLAPDVKAKFFVVSEGNS